MAGAVMGGVLGGSAAYYGAKKLPEVILPKWVPTGGPVLRIGPMTNANFPWVVLDRALIFHRAVSQRAHARRDKAQLSNSGGQGIVSGWPAATLAQYERQFQTLRGKLLPVGLRPAAETVRERLTDMLTQTLIEQDEENRKLEIAGRR
jgi:hypothetical protein